MMHSCQTCQSNLITDGLSPGQQIRCAQCSAISRFGKVEKIATHRLAWRSFWLGIASLLFLFLTGIPAVYYGVKSLLRMRFVKPKSSDRAAAIIGTSLGGCFGVGAGLVLGAGLIIGLLIYTTSTRTFVPAEVASLCDEIFEFDPPPGVSPFRANSVLRSIHYFEYYDHSDAKDTGIRIHLAHQGQALQSNKSQFINQLTKRRIQSNQRTDEVSHEILKWEINGQRVDVRKTVFNFVNEDNANSEQQTSHAVYHYFCYFYCERELFGLVVAYDPGRFEFSEEQVRELFAQTYARVNPDIDRGE